MCYPDASTCYYVLAFTQQQLYPDTRVDNRIIHEVSSVVLLETPRVACIAINTGQSCECYRAKFARRQRSVISSKHGQ